MSSPRVNSSNTPQKRVKYLYCRAFTRYIFAITGLI
jgi:hypothetical protein